MTPADQLDRLARDLVDGGYEPDMDTALAHLRAALLSDAEPVRSVWPPLAPSGIGYNAWGPVRRALWRAYVAVADTTTYRAGRVACRLLGRHGRSCRGRRDHMP